MSTATSPAVTSSSTTRTITELDSARLFTLMRRQFAALPNAREVIDVLDNAELVAPREIGADVITMQSLVVVEDLESGKRRELALCYPDKADGGAGRLSVLSPVGIGLLGLKTGDIARWTMPDGSPGAAKIVEVLFQPEASGDFLA